MTIGTLIGYLTAISISLMIARYLGRWFLSSWSWTADIRTTWRDVVRSVKEIRDIMSEMRDMLRDGKQRMDGQDKYIENHDHRIAHLENTSIDHEARIRVAEARQ